MSFSIKLLLFVGLFFLPTAYLFSQIEEAKLIEGDTVIRIDTIQIEKADTTVVEETVSDTVIVGEPISDPVEKKEFIKQDFYNDCLPSLKTNDVSLIDSNTYIISARLFFWLYAFGVSATLDIPINYNFNITSSYFKSMLGGDISYHWSVIGLGIGFICIRAENFILKFNISPSLIRSGDKGEKKKYALASHLGTEIFLGKIFSVGLDYFRTHTFTQDSNTFMISLGFHKLF